MCFCLLKRGNAIIMSVLKHKAKIDNIVKRENKLRIAIAKIVREIEGNGSNELCIDTDYSYKQYSKAILECPSGYHIEYTRNKYIIYVQDGYYYDIDTDLCVEEV